ncbi:helix-turn-helix transcriptional regulator [Paenibacillus antri]|uniref:Helix-turn-helix transcriptional regulator n=1 Tax=Paenibacillus antri TaxID=2582848 RepID=A0A5R9FYW7_9BACL|nr:helix-turn-helix domain-containing protein [Paenibacillus antri]TLS48701.1 helix-turn-helix transcriptional regulator [Paenibacillus antri]
MFRHTKVFRNFLISYLVILAIPSIAGYMSYRTSINVTTSVSIENSVTQLQKSKELLERRMAEVEGLTRQLAINQDLAVLINERATQESVNVYGIWKMMRDVTAVGQTNDFLRHFFIYLQNYNVVLAPGSAYFRPEHYYAIYHYADLPFEEWREQVLDATHRSELIPLKEFVSGTQRTSVITYMQSLPLDSFHDTSPAVVVVVIDEAAIASLLSGITDRYGGWVRVGDEQGGVVSLTGIEESAVAAMAADSRFDAGRISQFYEDDLVITIRSEKNGWVYQAGIPREALLENANKIKSITWTVTGIALFAGLLVGLALAYRNSAPIHRMLTVFGQEAKTGRNAFDFLQGNIAEMITNNRKLESELRRQQPLVRDAFYKRLIAGEFQSREEIVAAAVQSGAGLGGNAGFVGIVQINGYSGMNDVEVLNELSAARLILKQAMLDLAGPVPITELGADKSVVMLFSEEGSEGAFDRDQADALFRHLSELLFREYKISVFAAVGNPFASITDVSLAYEQAKLALERVDPTRTNDKSVVWYGETKPESDTYYYPLDVELRLLGTIRAGELEEAKRIVRMIVSENKDVRELSPEMKHQLALEIKGTLLKLLDQKTFQESEASVDVKARILALQSTESLDAFQAEVDAVMETMCHTIASKKNDMHVKIVEQIKSFVGERYSDAELTLYRIAERVERPEKYISQLFKEVTGTNLSDHLEQVRMDRAVELLKESAHTIDEIASLVGYNSSHSFRRAFKRVTGVSPSAYRQSVEN